MSETKNRHEAQRWIETALDDLEAAVILCSNGKHALACFHAQQASEKSVKAVYYRNALDPWGHSVTKLLQELVGFSEKYKQPVDALVNAARRLDQFYVPTRYPNGVPDITPANAFSEVDSKDAIHKAKMIMDVTKNLCT